MIDRIIEYSARNRFLVLLLVFFATAAGVWSLRTSPLDAIPDLSDAQVIVFADWPGRSPDIVEDQITYPIITTMIAAPRVKYVRGESMFGYSFVNVVFEAIRRSTNEVGGRLVEFNGTEYLVRGRGYVRSVEDIEQIAVGTNGSGTPVLVRDVGRVHLGPDLRRGLVELDGDGETVGGVVVMRHGQNALQVIEGVKRKLEEVKASLPPGVEIVSTYDRSTLIERAIDTLRHTLVEELLIVSGVILLFLWHLPSALIPIFTIPIAVLLAFIPMRALGLTANIMSLGGIAVAIGAMVDAAIVVVEQTHKKLERWQAEGRPGDFRDVVIAAVKEVGGPSFFSLLVIAVSFLPIFALEAQEGRLFKPLAFTKNFSMAIAAVLAITLDPAMRLLFTRLDRFTFKPVWLRRVANAVLVGTIHSEETHPISRPLMRF